jgi:hypothetical protein
MAQALNRRPLTAEARFAPGAVQRQTGTGTGSPTSSVLPCQYHYTIALHAHILYYLGDEQ